MTLDVRSARRSELFQLVSLRAQALAHVRGMIITGTLPPGQICSANSLAAELGISATPVREAMLDLVSIGLMEPVRNRGFRVVSLSDKDLEEIVELRLMLEVPTVVKLARRGLSAEDLEELSLIGEACQRAAAESDVPAFLALDRDFHLKMLGTGGNDRLTDLVAKLRDQTRLYGIESLARAGALEASAAEHFDLLDAVRRQDSTQTRSVGSRHLKHARGAWAGRPEPWVQEGQDA
jgi:DNA-binding GntR family transcriptional regulator